MPTQFESAKRLAAIGAFTGAGVGLVGFVPCLIGLHAVAVPPLIGLTNFGQIGMLAVLPAILLACECSVISLLCYKGKPAVWSLQFVLLLMAAFTKPCLPDQHWNSAVVVSIAVLATLPAVAVPVADKYLRKFRLCRMHDAPLEPPMIAG